MVKKNKWKTISIILIFAILISGLFYFLSESNLVGQEIVSTDCSATATILGVTSSNVQINNEGPKPNLRILVTANKQGECAKLSFSSSDISTIESSLATQGYGLTATGKTNLQNMVLDVKLIKQEKIFNAFENKVSGKVITIQKLYVSDYLTFWQSGIFFSNDACLSVQAQGKIPGINLGSAVYFHGFPPVADEYCYQEIQYGNLGGWTSEEQTNTVTDFLFNGIKFGTVTSDDISAIKDNKDLSITKPGTVTIKYVGSLVSPQGYDFVRPDYDTFWQQNQFYLVDKGADPILYTGYLTLKSCILGTPSYGGYKAPTTAEFEKCVNTYNALVGLYIGDKTSTFKTQNGITNLEYVNNQLKVDVSNKPLTFPVFTIDTNADYIVIQKLSGIPDVTSNLANFNLDSQSSKDVSFTVKNTGSFTGSFNPSLTCNGVSQQLFQSTQTVSAGASFTFTGKVTLSSTTSQTVSCNFKVTDLNGGASDTDLFDVTIIPRECQEATYSCSITNSDELQICTDGKWVLKQTCDNGCWIGPSGPECKGEETLIEICGNGVDDDLNGLVDSQDSACTGGGGEEDKDQDEYCKGSTEFLSVTVLPDFNNRPREGLEVVSGFFLGEDTIACTSTADYIKWAFASIVFILSSILITSNLNILFEKSLIKSRRLKGLRVIISLILGLVLSAFAYFVTYLLFWWGVLIAVVLIILYVVLKSRY